MSRRSYIRYHGQWSKFRYQISLNMIIEQKFRHQTSCSMIRVQILDIIDHGQWAEVQTSDIMVNDQSSEIMVNEQKFRVQISEIRVQSSDIRDQRSRTTRLGSWCGFLKSRLKMPFLFCESDILKQDFWKKFQKSLYKKKKAVKCAFKISF